jgi:hypothetical protein
MKMPYHIKLLNILHRRSCLIPDIHGIRAKRDKSGAKRDKSGAASIDFKLQRYYRIFKTRRGEWDFVSLHVLFYCKYLKYTVEINSTFKYNKLVTEDSP